MSGNPVVAIDPAILDGQPYIRGTQLTLRHLVETLMRARSVAPILREYPQLEPEQLRAAADFAAQYFAAAQPAA